jgi:predicted acetyltransferase
MHVEVLAATVDDRVALANLLELYLYDFTEFTGTDVGDDGRFGYSLLDRYWTDADRHPFLIRADGQLAGFALVRAGRPHDMAEFFVLRKYRGRGVAEHAARVLFARFPGEWQVRELAANARATAFWRRAIPYPFTEDENDRGPVQHFHSVDPA